MKMTEIQQHNSNATSAAIANGSVSYGKHMINIAPKPEYNRTNLHVSYIKSVFICENPNQIHIKVSSGVEKINAIYTPNINTHQLQFGSVPLQTVNFRVWVFLGRNKRYCENSDVGLVRTYI